MEEIEVGDYIRTSHGTIRKYKYERHKELINENGIYKILTWRGATVIGIESITKHSKNIIDLIEVGDYVNGEKVFAIEKHYERICVQKDSLNEFWINIKEPFLKSIVTHQQFASMEYKVGE